MAKIRVEGKEYVVPDGEYCTDIGKSICDYDFFKRCVLFSQDLKLKFIDDNNFHYTICEKCAACISATVNPDKIGTDAKRRGEK